MMFMFLITVQEEILLISLQFRNFDYSSVLEVLGSILAAIACYHIIYMVIYICTHCFVYSTDEKKSNLLLGKLEWGSILSMEELRRTFICNKSKL